MADEIRYEFRPTDAQYAHLCREAKNEGLSIADYVRKLIARDMQRRATGLRRNAVTGLTPSKKPQ